MMSAEPLTAVRERIRALLPRRRDVIVLAIDGIPYDLGVELWTDGRVSPMRSVFPTTSSAAWLSSLTGAEVATHGIPGVVFRVGGEAPVNVFEYCGALGTPNVGNLFADAAAEGFTPLAIVGDCEPLNCSWRSELLRDAEWVRGYRFFTAPSERAAEAICDDVRRAVASCLGAASARPRLVWCYVDADRLIHCNGYDDEVRRFLRGVGGLAAELACGGAQVVAYSDHGLTPTTHDSGVAEAIDRIAAEEQCALGGAGRTRWLYPQPDCADPIAVRLRSALPSTIEVAHADQLFEKGSLARARVGDVVLVAHGETFVTWSGETYEHGSATEAEILVPFAEWQA